MSMKNRDLIFSVVVVGLALGTAWAVRGKFGHEQGAAWAGGIGALSVILLARRADWYQRTFRILLAGAFGWGLSGMMSYGAIVGYGRAGDFINAFYGLLMLFVLGCLYGFLGGGLFGLALVDTKPAPVKWHSLLAEMVAIALLTYGLLVNQLGWLMTPPRSELWAACLGASLALAWFIHRRQLNNVMKVAVWSALGAGFGFAFGNFLQVMGNVSGVQFNLWNVMEYSIGFFGGMGMAYGTFTGSWPVSTQKATGPYDLIAILFVALFIPFVVWEQSFVTDRFSFVPESDRTPITIFSIKLIAIVAIAIVAAVALQLRRTIDGSAPALHIPLRRFFVWYTGLYIFLSFLVTGLFVHPLEQYLYVVNLIVILLWMRESRQTFEIRESRPKTWVVLALASVALIAIMAVIAVSSHDGMRGSNVRFETSR